MNTAVGRVCYINNKLCASSHIFTTDWHIAVNRRSSKPKGTPSIKVATSVGQVAMSIAQKNRGWYLVHAKSSRMEKFQGCVTFHYEQ